MAKNITIQEKGSAENFSNVIKIKIPSQEDGDTEWVPQSESGLGVKEITANGTYLASTDNLKGYAVVAVFVPATSITGKDKTDGKTYRVEVDSFGNILKIPID